MAHLFEGVSIQIHILGMPAALEGGRCADSGSQLCPSRARIFPGKNLQLLGDGKLLAVVGLLIDRGDPCESPRRQSLCAGRSAWVSRSRSSLWLLSQGCAGPTGQMWGWPSASQREAMFHNRARRRLLYVL